jgi:hypothetical protein
MVMMIKKKWEKPMKKAPKPVDNQITPNSQIL